MTRKPTKKARPKSKSSEIRSRERRCDALYWHRGYKPPEICDILLDEGLFGAQPSPAAALRWVQERVKEIRGGAEPDAILKLQRPAETERAKQQLYKLLRDLQDIIEDNSMVTQQKVTPKGDVMTVSEPRWPAGVKEKAVKDAAVLVEKLALLSGVDVKGAGLTNEDGDRPQEQQAASGFDFNFSGKKLDSLIGERIGRGEIAN